MGDPEREREGEAVSGATPISPDAVKSSWRPHDAGTAGLLESVQRHKEFFPLRGGLLVVMEEFVPERPHVLALRKRIECIEISYAVSTRARVVLGSRRGGESRWDVVPGMRTILPCRRAPCDVDMVFEVEPAPIEAVTICITPGCLSDLMGTPLDLLPEDLTFDLAACDGNGRDCCSRMEPAVETAVFQILKCGMDGPARKLFVEGKALELLSLEIGRLSRRKAPGPPLRIEEIRKLHHVRQVMMDSMLDPPTLDQLARRVGLNGRKIKTGFRSLFGTTVYGYLHQCRMEKAMRLLNGDLSNVSEAAWAVGYVNVSHFSAAFRKRFGTRPGDYLRTSRRREAPAGRPLS